MICIICDNKVTENTSVTHKNPATDLPESICLICLDGITTIVRTEPAPDIPDMILPKLSIY